MTQRVRIAVSEPLRGVRPHARPTPVAADSTGAPRVRQLLQLRELQEERSRLARQQAAAVATCAEALERTLATVDATVREQLASVTAMATEIGLAIAREVVGTALDRGHVDPAPIVRRCLADAVDGLPEASLVVHLAVDDLSAVLAEIGRDPAMHARLQRASFEADPSLARGAVRVTTGAGVLLHEPRQILARIVEEIRQAVPA